MTKYKDMSFKQRLAENERITKCDNKFKKKYGVGRKQYARISLINSLGGECIECGFRDVRALQLDHIHSDGSKDRKRFGQNMSGLYHYYIRNFRIAQINLQVLCANCNWIKRYENNESSKVVIID